MRLYGIVKATNRGVNKKQLILKKKGKGENIAEPLAENIPRAYDVRKTIILFWGNFTLITAHNIVAVQPGCLQGRGWVSALVANTVVVHSNFF